MPIFETGSHRPTGAKVGRRVVLYVGAPKTGTTTVQAFLRTNQDRLLRQGFYIPNTGRAGIGQHIELPTIVNSQARRNGLERHVGLRTSDVVDRRDKFIVDLDAELSAAPDWHTLLLFSEYMFSSLPREVLAYREILAPYAERFESMMYLRRQDQWLASLTLQARKTGARADLELNPGSPERFAEGLRAWFYGSDHCHIRRLDAAFLHEGRLLPDFCQTIGIDSGDMDMTEVRANPAVLQEQIELLDAMNRKIAFYRFQDQIHYRSRFINVMTEVLSGKRVEFRRSAATKAFGSFNKINSWLRWKFDPQGPAHFFNIDFQGYVENVKNDARYSVEQLGLLIGEISRARTERGMASASLERSDDRSETIDRVVTAFMALRRDELAERRKNRRIAQASAKTQFADISAGGAEAPRRAPGRRRVKFARALLFVGAPDPQTTLLQGMLRRSRGKLMRQGIYIPRAACAGTGQHIEIPAMLLRGGPREDLLRHFDVGAETAAARTARFREELDDEIASAGECHTLLLFSEHMFYSEPDEIAIYPAFMSRYSRKLECLMYLRRQDYWLTALRLQARKADPSLSAHWNPLPPDKYFANLKAWRATCAATYARRYEPEFLNPRGLPADLADALGVHPRGFAALSIFAPSGPRRQQLELFDALNQKLGDLPAHLRVTYRQGFTPLLTELLGGDEARPSPADSRAILSAYEPANRWLAAEFDPTGPPSFFRDDIPDVVFDQADSDFYSNEALNRALLMLSARLRDLGQTSHEGSGSRERIIDAIVLNFLAIRRIESASARGPSI